MDKNRRQFLKIVFIGSGALIIEKILGPFFSKSLNVALDAPVVDKPKRKRQTAFKVVEDDKIFAVYDHTGEQIFEIDKTNE